ncbi:MAG: DEAD/DEAH box helicase, partial [Thermomicrobiales bacterium]|nr:DEAD/DEAH box helicase [Thermomicrobiales bacterium]
MTSAGDVGSHPESAIADVAVAGARASAVLSYEIPVDLRGVLGEGSAVWVPLRGKPTPGVVLRVHNDVPDFDLQPVIGQTDPPVALSPTQLRTARWLARETASGLMDTLSLFLPPSTTQRTQEYLTLPDPELDTSGFTPTQRKVLEYVRKHGSPNVESVRKAMGSSLVTVVPALEKAGALRVRHRIVTHQPRAPEDRWVRLMGSPDSADLSRAPKQAELLSALQRRARLAADGWVRTSELLAQTGLPRTVLSGLLDKGLVEEASRPRGAMSPPARPDTIPALTGAQATAWQSIERSLQQQAGETFLLYGVTGSGKTELYLRAAAWCLRHGRSAIILTPEIALSSQVAARFTARFGDRVAVLHSALSPNERVATWKTVAASDCPIVVGPRSALFAPVHNPGLIVLDEEHE